MTLLSDALGISKAAVRSADPEAAVLREVRRTRRGLRIGPRLVPVPRGSLVEFVAIGKAAGAMLTSALRVAGASARGIAVTPRGYPGPREGLPVLFGDHPVPGRASFSAGRKIHEHVRRIAPDNVVVFLLSGGGSATAEVPAPGLEPEEISRTTRLLLGSGAPIQAMNTIRRHISLLKGGQLAVACPGKFATVAISDVVGDSPCDIASGPTVPDPTTYADALRAVRRFHLAPRLPDRVLEHLRAGARGERPETPKPHDPRFRNSWFVLAATNRTALRAAKREAQRRGYRPSVLSRPVVGENRAAGRAFAARVFLAARSPGSARPVALLAGGETTVALGRRPQRGGRNSEFAAAAMRSLDGTDALVLSVGTDGIDGTTPAAGGWVDGDSYGRARTLRLDLRRALASHATYRLLDRLGGLVRTGPTGTNVMDLHVGLARRPRRGQSRYGRK